jgi:hypothetical protein
MVSNQGSVRLLNKRKSFKHSFYESLKNTLEAHPPDADV